MPIIVSFIAVAVLSADGITHYLGTSMPSGMGGNHPMLSGPQQGIMLTGIVRRSAKAADSLPPNASPK